ncbi:hypothetical protein B0E42_29260 [Pseudomonas sp. A25(2017)]|uniref:hypothetical protein n=1 Tax=Pseudomonas sp. A25(2017) TaxID=1945865 RepID=UPI0009862AE0|nr:hypothetical protein [Pseudomonas sp. A25(2017)]OOG79741.1 hypothetical protein B0E42_29260 [Pseudomonas sp. A25(2017)]
MSNSLQNLLNRMQGRSITHQWGAIVAFSREQLNRLLEVQYLTWLHDGRFIPPINGVAYIDDRTESMTLDGVLLGKPVLSFETASLNESKVTLTMNLVAGTYTAKSHPVGGGAVRLLSSFTITEAMGYKVQMKLSLNQIEGEVDKRGRVTLDVASDLSMTCNLGGMPGVDKHLAALIQSRLAVLPQDQRIFELGLFDFSGYNPLSPTGFYIRTQKAPGSDDPADGAVLLFIRLKVHDENGAGIPIEGSDFPYLIPDDKVGGRRLYSASLVLNSEWIELLDEVQLDVLKNLLFPSDNFFIESQNGRHTPHDLLVLGNIGPKSDTVTVEPAFISLKSGGLPQAFVARKSDGSSINAQWTVTNPLSPLSVGTITTGGVYTPPNRTRMGKEQQPIVVTAQYTMGGKSQTSSALVLGVFESMNITPRVCLRGVGSNPTPVELTVTTLGNGSLRWPTLSPNEGMLDVIDNNHAIYTPPTSLTDPLAVQRIIVTDQQSNETIEATVVLMRAAHTLPVDPPYVAAVTAGDPIQLYADLEPDDEVRWVVIGEGDVDDNGVFTPPTQPTSRISVVRCSYLVNGSARSSGLSVIQLSEQVQPEPHWRELGEFSIAVNNGLDTCFSNGFQQIPVTVTIATQSVTVGGAELYIPVSDAELATLRLVDKITNNAIPFIPVGQEGIEYGKDTRWAVSKIKNRFRFFSATATRTYPLAPPTPKNNGVRYRELYLHLAYEGGRTFYAQFDSPYGTQNSTDEKTENFEVTVQGVRPATPSLSNYEFKRERKWQDEDGHDEPPSNAHPEWDYFSYYRQSIDYWYLSYLRRGVDSVLFATLSIENNISTMQWESELIDETFFSYTGYAFNPANFENSDSPVPEGLSFDPYLWGLMRNYQKNLKTSFDGERPAQGELIISLHRTDDVNYWYDGLASGDKRKMYRQQLDPSVYLILLDEEGNRHSLTVGFDSSSNENSRNRLMLSRR